MQVVDRHQNRRPFAEAFQDGQEARRHRMLIDLRPAYTGAKEYSIDRQALRERHIRQRGWFYAGQQVSQRRIRQHRFRRRRPRRQHNEPTLVRRRHGR
ncbi:hypothetical protein HNP02_007988 [Mycobacterium sp. AZCC_0083]|nr:hypothetical protein [Mycobacterium sp. AZCC_0083]